MPRTIRFHLDENCNPRIASGPRRKGIDVTTAADASLLHALDEDHLAFAERDQRVIFTQDADFLRMAATGISHPGIAYCQPSSRSIREILDRLVLIWEIYDPSDIMNRVEFL
jgi:predicted nuclease of predicted toxin-antitoxin system